ncbi:tripartite tricarboxylate transporter substrate binding protein [Bacillaceae bacterium]
MKAGRTLMVILFVLALAATVFAGGCSQSSPASGPANEGAANEQEKAQENAKTDYPKKPIEMTVGYSAGGGTDVVARIVVNAANKYLPNGQSIVVSNKPGASGTIQLAEIFQAKPDGYKIGSVTTGNLAIQPNFGKTPYKPNDFEPIAQFNSSQNLLVVRSDAPWKTFDEWLDYVKKNPGKFTYSTAGAGNTQHLAMEALSQFYGIQAKHVPFEGAAPAMTALLGGHVQGAVVLVQEAKPHTDAGEFRVLANLGTTKIDAYKDVPFLKEKGFVGLDTWSGVVAPKNTPKEIVAILNEAFEKALQDPEVVEQFKKIGIEPAYAGPEEFKKIIESTSATTAEVMKKAGLIK